MAASRLLVCLATIALFVHHVTATPKHTAYSGLQTIAKPFHATGRTPGTVTFEILPEPDPTRYGVPLLGFNSNFSTPNHTVGFPTAYGKVSSPNSLGYASYYGWVQIIASSNTTLPADQVQWTVDIVPTFQSLNNPFVSYGSEATLFDHPFPIGDLEELDWSARSYLSYLPNPAYSKTIVPLVAFEWGYWISDEVPKVKQLKSLDLKTWNSHLGLFKSGYTGWNFTRVV